MASVNMAANVMPPVKRQVRFERQMKVHSAGQKRQHTERKAHEEAEKIKIRPVHTTPRAQLPQLRELEFELPHHWGRFLRRPVLRKDLLNSPDLLAEDVRCPCSRQGATLLPTGPPVPALSEFQQSAIRHAENLRTPRPRATPAEVPGPR